MPNNKRLQVPISSPRYNLLRSIAERLFGNQDWRAGASTAAAHILENMTPAELEAAAKRNNQPTENTRADSHIAR